MPSICDHYLKGLLANGYAVDEKLLPYLKNDYFYLFGGGREVVYLKAKEWRLEDNFGEFPPPTI